jgi:myo-inositol-1(or 4)-monophosphatase
VSKPGVFQMEDCPAASGTPLAPSSSKADEVVIRIKEALDAAASALSAFTPGCIQADEKSGGRGPVTEADRVVSDVLREALVRDDEGWFSEESVDDLARLEHQRIWIVDPVDGTRDLVAGVPEWSVSVALVEDGRPVAGGVSNPSTGELFLGSLESGVTYNGSSVRVSGRKSLQGAVVLASRSEVERGEWERFSGGPLVIRPLGSIAYKLALVAAGLADATWTLCPKHEWDVAGGVALVEAAGGFAQSPRGSPIGFNLRSPRIVGLLAGGRDLRDELVRVLAAALP